MYGAFQRECPLSCHGREVCTISEPQGGTHEVRYLGSAPCQGQVSCRLHSKDTPLPLFHRWAALSKYLQLLIQILSYWRWSKSTNVWPLQLTVVWKCVDRKGPRRHPCTSLSAKGHHCPPGVSAEVTLWVLSS